MSRVPSEWEGLLRDAPDPSTIPALEDFLRGKQLDSELAEWIELEFVDPWLRSGIATRRNVCALWVNLGMAANLSHGSEASPEVADFLWGCSIRALKVGEGTYADLHCHFLRVRSLVLRVGCDVSVTPDMCLGLLEETTSYVVRIRTGMVDDPFGTLQHVPSALFSAIGALQVLMTRLALGTFDRPMLDLCEISLELVRGCGEERSGIDRAWGVANSGGGPFRTPDAFLHFVAASAVWHMLPDDVGLFDDVDAHQVSLAEHALDHVRFAEEGLSNRSAVEAEALFLEKGELLIFLRRPTEVLDLIDHTAAVPMDEHRRRSLLVRARVLLGEKEVARDLLAELVPTTAVVVERWKLLWTGAQATLGPDSSRFLPVVDRSQDERLIRAQVEWRLLAYLSSALQRPEEAFSWSSKAFGFLIDSCICERSEWMQLMRSYARKAKVVVTPMLESNSATTALFMDTINQSDLATGIPTPQSTIPPDPLDPPEANVQVEEIAQRMGSEGAVLLTFVVEGRLQTQVVRANGILPDVGDEPYRTLQEALDTWNRFYFEELRKDPPSHVWRAEEPFAHLVESVGAVWASLFEELLDDGVSRLVIIPDELLADIPFHAALLPERGMPLIDCCEVVYAPSLLSLWRSWTRAVLPKERRIGSAVRQMVDTNLEGADEEARAISGILGTKEERIDPLVPSFWEDLTSAEVLHIIAHGEHRSILPLNSILLRGWLDLPLFMLLAGLDLPQCDLVSNLACESAFPAIRQVPGLDLSTVFLAAGARNVLASTWVVKTSTASQFAQSFFEEWVGGSSPGQAFQNAVSKIRRDPSVPTVCWASLRLVGAP